LAGSYYGVPGGAIRPPGCMAACGGFSILLTARSAGRAAAGTGVRNLSPRPDDSLYEVSHLQTLEAEAVHVMREVAAELERPVLLFSGGKDSVVLLRLAEKAFRPGRFPFPIMHVDTGHNFPEVLEFRDRRVAELGERLIVASVQESIDSGRVVEETGPRASRNRLQTTTLLDAIAEHGFDAALGGARRDEERARAKERIFSFRDDFGQWDPKKQRPELWAIYNGRVRRGEHVRVFPLSNWTELDVWQYIEHEGLELPSIYFAHERDVFRRDGMIYAHGPYVQLIDGETVERASVRYRTVGDMTCTGAVASRAGTLAEVIAEIAATSISERGETRADDRVTEAAMEDRKREGYF
jgi:sulfate adenylyltransferase subunit 2